MFFYQSYTPQYRFCFDVGNRRYKSLDLVTRTIYTFQKVTSGENTPNFSMVTNSIPHYVHIIHEYDNITLTFKCHL